jgi:hypothetical protein
MKKPMKDTTTVCPWCKMGLELEVLEELVAKARKEKKVPRAFLKRWHEDLARDKGSQK